MLSSWLSGSAGKKDQRPQINVPSGVETNTIIKQILGKIEQQLDKELGESSHEQIMKMTQSVANSQILQKSLLDTKQKYNNLINKVDQEHQELKQIVLLMSNFIKVVSNSLHSEDMLIPLKDIEKGILQFNSNKVEKNLKYLNKLYESALQDIIKIRVGSKKQELQDELNLIRNLNKSLQVELFRVRRDKTDLQNKLSDSLCKSSQLQQKLTILQKLGTQANLQLQMKEREKIKSRQNELLARIKTLQMEKGRLDKLKKQADLQVVKSGSSIEVMRQNQENVIEELQQEIKRKELKFEQTFKKMYNEKSQLEEKMGFLSSQIQKMQMQNASKSTLTLQNNKSESLQKSVKELKDRVCDLEQEKANLNKSIKGTVSRDMLRSLFINYDDQSKEWSVKKDIKSQIQTLLEIQPKKQNKAEEKKWIWPF